MEGPINIGSNRDRIRTKQEGKLFLGSSLLLISSLRTDHMDL